MTAHTLKAEITGSVCQLLVPPGAAVAADEAVLMLESMKMEIPVVAPRAGVVREVFVAIGDMVSEGDALARIDSQEP